MNKINYQLQLDKILDNLQKKQEIPRLLLHSCCAPCSSYVLEYLSDYFQITVFYYNPNISPAREYQQRVREQKRLIEEMAFRHPVYFQEGNYEPKRFYEMARGMEHLPEGQKRCDACYRLRLGEAAKSGAAGGYDYFTTTLSISPLKNAQKLNEIGISLGEECKIPYLPSDFKKRNGYGRSLELSAQYHLYRQNYCGCIFSRRGSQTANCRE
ncbi:MAG: epoxyqueuosine reductase QueH [Lachnospiraceae bacterium]|nr:epoxyqueuosine reductase QueH [Lachnospiraceae bacterium]